MAAAAPPSASAATVANGFVMQNVFFDAGADFWTFDSPWLHDGGQTAAVFQTNNTNVAGEFAARGTPVDLTAESAVLALDDYDPDFALLTDLTFADPFRLFNFGTIPADGDYNLFIRYDIETTGGTYRAETQKLNNPFVNTTAQQGFIFDWLVGGGLLGDPFAGGGGVALSEIIDMDYDVIFEVLTPTTSADSGFYGIEAFNVQYEVTQTPVPEPGSVAAIAFVGCGLLMRRRGNTQS